MSLGAIETSDEDAIPLDALQVGALIRGSATHFGGPTADQVLVGDIRACLRDLVATIELHTDCMDGRIDREALEPYIERAEDLLGETTIEIINQTRSA